MKVKLFLQPELMQAFISSMNLTETPSIFVNKKSRVYVYKESGLTFKYLGDIDKESRLNDVTHLYYSSLSNLPIDQELFAYLSYSGIVLVDIASLRLLES